jgi:hypothetical protein
MAKLIYAAFTSLDGYVTDETGNFDWAELDEEVHAFINSRERQIGTYLFGRKMYETMAVWETPDVFPHRTAAVLEFAPIWQAAEKIVYSTTLQTVSTAKTLGAEIRGGRCTGTQGRSDPRGWGGRSGARSACHSSWPCRRISPTHRADHRGQRRSLSARQGPREARTSR